MLGTCTVCERAGACILPSSSIPPQQFCSVRDKKTMTYPHASYARHAT